VIAGVELACRVSQAPATSENASVQLPLSATNRSAGSNLFATVEQLFELPKYGTRQASKGAAKT